MRMAIFAGHGGQNCCGLTVVSVLDVLKEIFDCVFEEAFGVSDCYLEEFEFEIDLGVIY